MNLFVRASDSELTDFWERAQACGARNTELMFRSEEMPFGVVPERSDIVLTAACDCTVMPCECPGLRLRCRPVEMMLPISPSSVARFMQNQEIGFRSVGDFVAWVRGDLTQAMGGAPVAAPPPVTPEIGAPTGPGFDIEAMMLSLGLNQGAEFSHLANEELPGDGVELVLGPGSEATTETESVELGTEISPAPDNVPGDTATAATLPLVIDADMEAALTEVAARRTQSSAEAELAGAVRLWKLVSDAELQGGQLEIRDFHGGRHIIRTDNQLGEGS